jgi:hypothetical protein
LSGVPRIGELRRILLRQSLRLFELRLIGARIDLCEKIPRIHLLALREGDLLHLPSVRTLAST